MNFLSRAGKRFVDVTHRGGRAAPALVVLLIVIAPLLAWGIWGALRDADNDLVAWVDDHLPAKQTFSDFVRKFGRQDLVVISWPGCTLADPRLPELDRQLSLSGDSGCFDRVTTSSELLSKLTAEPFNLPRGRVIQSLVGNLLGPDRETSCLILKLSETGAENRVRSTTAIRSAAERVANLDPQTLRLGGPAIEQWALTDESIRSPVFLCGIAVVFITIISRVLLRSWSLCVLVVGLAVFNGAFSAAIVYFSGNGMNAVLMPMPTLVMVLSVSCSVHVVNYHRKATEAGADDVVRATLESAWLPCVLSALTTAIGLAALITSNTDPVREFGFYSAVSILFGTALILLILPTMISRFSNATISSAKRSPTWNEWAWLANFINYLQWPVVLAGIGVIVFCALGLRWLDTSMNVSNTFSSRTRVIRDAQWLEQYVRPLSQLEIIVTFDESNKLSSVGRLLLVSKVANALRQDPKIHAALSLADFLPTPPTSGSIRDVARRAVLKRYLEDNPERLIETGYLAVVDGIQSWRISISISSLSSTRYAHLIDAARRSAEKTVDEAGHGLGIQIQCTGAIALYEEIQRQMLKDLLNTYATAFLAITATMCLVLGNVWAGLIAMIPNLFPAVVMLGLLGWLNVKMDVGSIMTASVALGIAVDGTLHYVIAFRRRVAGGSSQVQGIEFGYSRCGVALTQATVICALGIHLLGYSDFLPTARFGWLIAAMLTLALLGDLILLPALLVGPLGRLFTREPHP